MSPELMTSAVAAKRAKIDAVLARREHIAGIVDVDVAVVAPRQAVDAVADDRGQVRIVVDVDVAVVAVGDAPQRVLAGRYRLIVVDDDVGAITLRLHVEAAVAGQQNAIVGDVGRAVVRRRRDVDAVAQKDAVVVVDLRHRPGKRAVLESLLGHRRFRRHRHALAAAGWLSTAVAQETKTEKTFDNWVVIAARRRKGRTVPCRRRSATPRPSRWCLRCCSRAPRTARTS